MAVLPSILSSQLTIIYLWLAKILVRVIMLLRYVGAQTYCMSLNNKGEMGSTPVLPGS